MNQKTVYKKYSVQFDNNSYNILIGKDALIDNVVNILNAKTKNKNIALVFDTFFKDKIGNSLATDLSNMGYKVYPYPMVAGKQNKTVSEALRIYELLETNELSRDSTIIALGGGVIGDLAGFVASTYLRGINLINIPTTLTAMIDSSIGGKVGVNFRKTINAIGNFYHPIGNIVHLGFIDSLPERDFKAGLAEIIKCAVISDKDLFNYFESNFKKIFQRNEESLLHIMCRAIEIKLNHVLNDVREQGKRMKLNYGHTLGHSIEVSTDILKEVYRHGEGVALGMVGAAFIAKEYFRQNGDILKQHENILIKYGLPIRVDVKNIGFDRVNLIDECVLNIYKDKKKQNNRLRFVLPKAIGNCEVYNDLPDSLVREAFSYLIKE